MTAGKARAIIKKLDQKSSIFHRNITYWSNDDINDLQRARGLLIDCLCETELSRLDYDRKLWDRKMDSLLIIGYPRRLHTTLMIKRRRFPIPNITPELLRYCDYLQGIFQDIKTMF